MKVLKLTDLKLRPIVAGPQALIQKLRLFCSLMLSYKWYGIDFFKHIPPTVPEGTILTSFGVTNLYTDIP